MSWHTCLALWSAIAGLSLITIGCVFRPRRSRGLPPPRCDLIVRNSRYW